MTEHHEPHTTVPLEKRWEEGDTLTPERAATLVFHSFRFSQGIPSIQRAVLAWLHKEYGWKLEAGSRDDAKRHLTPMLEQFRDKRFGSSHADVSDTYFERAIEETDEFFEVLAGDHAPSQEDISEISREEEQSLLGNILWGMVARDATFIVSNEQEPAKGRPGHLRGSSISEGGQNDKWASFVCKYVLAGKRTGIPEFDRLSEELQIHSRSTGLSRELTSRLQILVKEYNRYHPDTPVEWKPPAVSA